MIKADSLRKLNGGIIANGIIASVETFKINRSLDKVSDYSSSIS
jgi:hypothetical protein